MPAKTTSPTTVDPGSVARRPAPPIWQTPSGDPANFHGILNGCSVFMAASGPSFGKLDTTKLNQPGCLTMGLNNSPKTCRPNLWISVDDPSHFLQSIWLDPGIMKFARSRHREAPLFDSESRVQTNTTAAECPNVVFYEADLEFKAANFLTKDSVSWGTNDPAGGGRSVMLAALKTLYHLGAGHVFLLGVDFRMAADHTYHFRQHRSKDSIEGNNKTYKILSDRFAELQPLFEEAGFHVWNCNPDSKLRVFPFLPFGEALEFATCRMPADLESESSSGLYDRVEGRNDSAGIFAPRHPGNRETTLGRVDRSKRPKIIKAETLDPHVPPNGSSGVVLLADRKLEWLLPWWFHHFGQSNPNLPVSLADFGLSGEARQWLGDKNVLLLPKPGNLPEFYSNWFYKPFVIAASPFENTIFSDLDCEIRGDLSRMFSWSEHGLVLGNDLYPLGRGRKLFRAQQYYNSGLIGVRRDNAILDQWCGETGELHETLHSDQEILNLTIYQSEATVIELPAHFHQLRLDGDHKEAVVMHWTGEPGNVHIRRQLGQLPALKARPHNGMV